MLDIKWIIGSVFSVFLLNGCSDGPGSLKGVCLEAYNAHTEHVEQNKEALDQFPGLTKEQIKENTYELLKESDENVCRNFLDNLKENNRKQ